MHPTHATTSRNGNAIAGVGRAGLGRMFVRVTGRRGAFVEFEFAIGDPDLHLDLVLPEAAFTEFCRTNAVETLDAPSGGTPCRSISAPSR